jgi:HEAT repeat protein
MVSDEYRGVREVAARDLGQLHDKRTVTRLTRALEDDDVDVRDSAKHALWRLQR